MEAGFTFISFLDLGLIVTGITLSMVLWNFPKEKNSANKILSVAMLAIAWILFVGFLIETRLITHLPHFYRTGHIAFLALAPLPYLYVRHIVLKQNISAADTVHAIPLALYLVDYIAFFLLPADQKLLLIRQDISGFKTTNSFDEGWFSSDVFYYLLQLLLVFFYWILQVRLLYLHVFKGSASGHDKAPRSWLYYFISTQLCGFVPLLVKETDAHVHWTIVTVAAGAPVAGMTLWLFLKPEILYGLPEQEAIESITDAVVYKQHNGADIHAQALTTLHDKDMAQQLHAYMTESKKFLQPKYTINQLSSELNIPPHHLSNFLNHQLHISFHDFLNKFRVEHCIERIKKGDAQRLTLEALSFECGFSNRNSFTIAFKRVTGITPSDFIRYVRLTG
ncbi:helix-turn-helix domain-containing protein [Fulvivirgaceae bacterium PWU4]|uniref:Helix-turn-helix domain-containing protein n=1 Tax=Chryseosolibacter histidini TaxID=2782349 RepID=A0AAP2DNC1_9BACT|nr:helix-turn-helix domain-containing protein [Chryseosolibacter histidini]MBT1699530.1 helix-turn-helix domain-containing protein [Chryseosolibacter histidini]